MISALVLVTTAVSLFTAAPTNEAPPAERRKPDITLAMIVLERASLPDARGLAMACSKRWGKALPVTESPRDPATLPRPPGATRSMTLVLPSATVLVALIPKPIPERGLAEAAAGDSADRPAALPAHTAHMAVFLFSTAGAHDVIDRHLLLTRVLACLLDATASIGVYRHGALTARGIFVRLANDMSREKLPLPLWVPVVRLKRQGERFVIATRGLATFGRKEIVVTTRKPQEAAELLYQLGHHVIDSGADFADGQPIGRPGAPEIKTRQGALPWDRGQAVTWMDL